MRIVCAGYAGEGAGEGRDGARHRRQGSNGHEGESLRHITCLLAVARRSRSRIFVYTVCIGF